MPVRVLDHLQPVNALHSASALALCFALTLQWGCHDRLHAAPFKPLSWYKANLDCLQVSKQRLYRFMTCPAPFWRSALPDSRGGT